MRHKNFRTFRNVDAQEITRAMMRRVLIGDSEIVLRDYAAFERASGERARLASRASPVPRNALRARAPGRGDDGDLDGISPY